MSLKLSGSYIDPSEPGSFGGVNAFAKANKSSQSQAKQQLEQLLSYRLHKQRRRRFPTLPTKVFSINEQFVMDLVDLQTLAKYNKGYKYLLTVIDVLWKYAYRFGRSLRKTLFFHAWRSSWLGGGTLEPNVENHNVLLFYREKHVELYWGVTCSRENLKSFVLS